LPTFRLFVAVPLPAELQAKWESLIAAFSDHPAVKWVSTRQMHVTLCFIGNWEEDLLPSLERSLAEVSSSQPVFKAVLGGLGGFPDLLRPKVLFGSILDGEKSFQALSRDISKALVKLGIPQEKNYHPHVTLGRVREGREVVSLVAPLRLNLEWVSDNWRVDHFVLFRSRLTPEGALYIPLKEFKLEG